jgi:ribose transport system ATP-binding protein
VSDGPVRGVAAGAAPAPPPALDASNLAKRFGPQTALAGVDLTVGRGEVVALLGENGSGKSTLVKILAGYHEPEPGGGLRVAGTEVPLPVPRGGYRELGLSFVFQDLGLAPGLRVVENLFVGRRAARRAKRVRAINWPAERRAARAVLDAYQVRLDPGALVADLRPTDQALLAIVRAAEELREFRTITAGPTVPHSLGGGVLVLDEPTVFLPEEEKVFLFDLVRRVTADGTGVLFVSHDMTAVRQIAHRAVVLRDGRLAGDVTVADVCDADLVRLISGHSAERSDGAPPAAVVPDSAPGGPLLAAGELSGGRLRGASLAVRPGEIVAVAGLLGSGAEDLPYALFGGLPAATGRLRVAGWSGDAATLTPRQASKLGLALVPADRKAQGLAPELSVAENMMALVLGDHFRRGVLARGQLRQAAAERCRGYGIRPADPGNPVAALSGGNQQRVLLAKWLERRPRVLLLHEPTQGVDVATRAEIYDLLRGLAAEGLGILWVSTDFDELAAVADRVLVCAAGVVAEQLPSPPFSRDQITSAVYAASAQGAGPHDAGSVMSHGR